MTKTESSNRAIKAMKIADALRSINVSAVEAVEMNQEQWNLAARAAGYETISATTVELVILDLRRGCRECDDNFGTCERHPRPPEPAAPPRPVPYEHIPIEEWNARVASISPAALTAFGRRIAWRSALLTIYGPDRSPGRENYWVTLDSGEWPLDPEELIVLCENKIPPREPALGGYVGQPRNNRRYVAVYTD